MPAVRVRAERLTKGKAARNSWRRMCAAVLLALALSAPLSAQIPKAPASPAKPPPDGAQDPLGRATPRGAVLGFLNAAHKGENSMAALYLNTRVRGAAASTLAHQLSVVLDRRLPANLQRLSDKPEGSLVDPLNPRRDLVGTISSPTGDVDIFVERVDRGKLGIVWLFSDETLDSIPELYKEVGAISIDRFFPGWLARNRIAGVPLYEWLVLLIGIPLVYLATGFVNRFLSAVAGRVARSLLRKPELRNPGILAKPVRLLVVSVTIFAGRDNLGLTLMARQVCTGVAAVMTLASGVWLLIIWNGKWEGYLRRRLDRRNHRSAFSVVRLARRAVDVMVLFAGLLAGLKYFRLNITAALAGLGVGGIAVALAAQKTLENVIGGISIIMDRAVQVGDFVKVGDTLGTVEDIGLRSTRIRTNERTVVSIPNGQIANISLENFSRDKFWLHHFVGLRYDTKAPQLCSVVARLEDLLLRHPLVEQSSARVRFLRFGTSSLDLEIFAYIMARDYVHFLEIQNELLLRLMQVVEESGTQIALQTPVLTVSALSDANGNPPRKRSRRAAECDPEHGERRRHRAS